MMEDYIMIKVINIPSGDLRKKSVLLKWSNHSLKIASIVVNEWLDTLRAESVLLFFKDDSAPDLHAYMPIVKNSSRKPKKNPEYSVADLKGAKGETKIIGIEPFPIEGSITKDDFDAIVMIMNNDYFWHGNEIYRICKDGGIRVSDADFDVEWKERKYGKDRVRAVLKVPVIQKPAAAKNPAAGKKSATAKKSTVVKKPASVKKPAVKKLTAKKSSVVKKPEVKKKISIKESSKKLKIQKKPAAKKTAIK